MLDCTYPRETQTVYSIGQHIAQQTGRWIQGWEVSMHVWALPMRHTRHNAFLNVGEYVLPAFAVKRGRRRQDISQVSRWDRWIHTPRTDILQVISDVIHHFLSFFLQFLNVYDYLRSLTFKEIVRTRYILSSFICNSIYKLQINFFKTLEKVKLCCTH